MSNNSQEFSKLGFVLSAAGSAIGLGNIWRLPAQVAQYGGGTYLFVYFAICLTFGLSVLLAEFAIGRYFGENYFNRSKEVLAENNKPKAWYAGLVLSHVTPIIILSFYFVVCGWVLYYFFGSLFGQVSYNATVGTPSYYEGVFVGLIGNFKLVYALVIVFIVATAAINYRGVTAGIEKANFLLLPLLFIILVVMIIRSLTLPGAGAGVAYIFSIDFSVINKELIIAALKQSFFSLSIGSGIMIAFSSASGKTMHLRNTAIYTVALGAGVGLFTSLLIVPAVFAFGYDLNGGPALTFMTLPNIFANLPFGFVLASLFFLVMLMAALTSTISLYEVPTQLFSKVFNLSRQKVVLWLIVLFVAITFVQTASFSFLSNLSIGKLGIFDFSANLTDLMLVIFGLVSCIFATWLVAGKYIKNEVSSNGLYNVETTNYKLWYYFTKFVAPVILTVLIFLVVQSLF